MATSGPNILGRELRYPKGSVVPTVYLSGNRNTVTATSVSTAETALPAGSVAIIIRALEGVWIRFGNTGLGAATADDNSVLFPAGESVIPVPLVSADGAPATHFRVLRATANDTPVQIEQIKTVSGV